jgi:flagellar protein FliO/FliZ
MGNYFFWMFILVALAVLSVSAVAFLRGSLPWGAGNAFFRPRGDRRLEVVDQANVDGRRRLLLLRRDDVEHLIMTGGPVDVVIETGIKSAAARPALVTPDDAVVAPAPVRRTPVFGTPDAPLLGAQER